MGALCSIDKHGDHPDGGSVRKAKLPASTKSCSDYQTTAAMTLRDEKRPLVSCIVDPWGGVPEHAPDEAEQVANERVQIARNNDDAEIFEPASCFPPLQLHGFQGQQHGRYAGDHYLRNVGLMNGLGHVTYERARGDQGEKETQELYLRKAHLLRIAERMPKGGHLHIHFNATLQPDFLLDLAEGQAHMRIWSTKPLRSREALETCEIQFVLLNDSRHMISVFDRAYEFTNPDLPTTDEFAERKMLYSSYREEWEELRCSYNGSYQDSPVVIRKRFTEEEWRSLQPCIGRPYKEWLTEKLCFQTDEAHNSAQNQDGAWHKFNTRTRMMKGLFNYETAYRAYTQACLQEFVRDNVQYAEIRPNFMSTNQIWKDDGSKSLDNSNTMEIIIEEYQKFMIAHDAMNECGEMLENRAIKNGQVLYNQDGLPVWDQQNRPVFSGLKVIYCTPRSFKRQQIREALEQCLEFKLRWPQYIAGFDLVGEESKGHPLSFFRDLFHEFQETCGKRGVDIPFLFHCGETQYDPDDNLETAILDIPNTRRIGHGYALLNKPHLRGPAQAKNLCIESCPISNEILGLCPVIEMHHVYGLLGENYHVTLNSDNGTLFRSTLAHDFYQFLVGRRAGRQKMTLHVCKQMAEWSLDHACMDKDEKERAKVEWQLRWSEFITWINNCPDFASRVETKKERAAREAAEKEEAANHELEIKANKQKL